MRPLHLMKHGKGAAMPDKVFGRYACLVEFFRLKDLRLRRLKEYPKLNLVCYVGQIAAGLYQNARTNKEIKVIKSAF